MRALKTLALLLVLAVPAVAQDRVLDYSRPAEGIATVVLEAGVGDVTITGDGTDTISARIELNAKNSFWSRSGRRDVERAEVVATVRGDTLTLRVTPRDEHSSFGEDWTIHVPPGIALDVNLGVGDVTVLDTAADIEVDLGVGDVRIESEYRSFGSISASSGVGDATLRTPDGREDGDGFVGHHLRGKGPGKASIEVSAGVGDTLIRLR